MTAQVWAAAIAIMAVMFWFTTKDDPVSRERRASGEKAASAWLELEPLKNIQVWRFSLYYFFVFGAFRGAGAVAAALPDRRLRPRHRDRRHDGRGLFDSRPACSAPMAAISPTATARGA